MEELNKYKFQQDMSTQEKVMQIVTEVCEVAVSEVTLNSAIGDFPAWDSMGQLAILQRVESEFDIQFEPEDMMEIEDVNDIVKAVEAKL